MVAQEDLNHRFRYHAPDEAKKTKHEAVRWECNSLAGYLNSVLPEGREKSIALTKLEEVMFWANASLARN